MNAMTMPFPIGYHSLHPDTSINFQMNRFYNWVGDSAMLTELRSVAPRIATYADLDREVMGLAEGALTSGRLLSGAYYLRLAEFFLFAEDPRKKQVRQRFLQTLRGVYGNELPEPHRVPADGCVLRAYRFEATSPRGRLVLFGGFDSYIEEWWPMFRHLNGLGFDLTVFEGPGQGACIEEDGVAFSPEWERPVRAILDHFNLEAVTLIGLSLGGGLAIRAAASEPRVSRVVAIDILTDFLEVVLRQTSPVVRAALRALLVIKARGIVDALVRTQMRRSPVVEWGIRHGMHVMGADSPGAFFEAASRFQTRECSGRVTQDVLLLAGADDHFVPLRQLYEQMAWLTQARSVTARIYTAHESASNHCQVGNLGLALEGVVDWIDAVSAGSRVG